MIFLKSLVWMLVFLQVRFSLIGVNDIIVLIIFLNILCILIGMYVGRVRWRYIGRHFYLVSFIFVLRIRFSGGGLCDVPSFSNHNATSQTHHKKHKTCTYGCNDNGARDDFIGRISVLYLNRVAGCIFIRGMRICSFTSVFIVFHKYNHSTGI